LRGESLSGPPPRRIGIRDVAQRAGVAISTVSKVFSGKGEVMPALRLRVLTAAAELGYQPNFLAQSLRRGATDLIGFVAPDLSDPAPTVPPTAQDEAAPHEPPETAAGGLTGSDAIPPASGPPSSPLATLSPRARLALLETALAIRERGVETKGGGMRGAPLGDFAKDPTGTWSELYMPKLVKVGQPANGAGFIAILNETALEALATEYPGGVNIDHVMAARVDAESFAGGIGGFATPWLNPAPKPATAASSSPLGGGGARSATEGVPTGGATPTGDIIVGGMRQALADLWQAGKAPLDILRRLEDGEGAGDDEIAAAAKALQGALMAAALFVPAEMKEQG